MSKNNTPAVSVLMPVYNADKYLPPAIESILNQSFRDFEFIIIDDGSTDSSFKIIKKFAENDKRIIFIKNKKNLGICESLNSGLSLARGQYVARMDADDWSYPARLEKQLSFLKRHPKTVICGGAIEICDNRLKVKNKRRYPTSDKKIREKILKINPFAHPVVMYKKRAVSEAGGYNKKLLTVEDYDLYFRLGKLGKFANLPQKLLKLRTHPDSISYKEINNQAKLNLYIRIKTVFEYKYIMSLSDKIYFLINFVGVLLIPKFLKFRTYSFLRKFQK